MFAFLHFLTFALLPKDIILVFLALIDRAFPEHHLENEFRGNWLTLRFIYGHFISGFHSLQYFIEWRSFLIVQQVESYACFNIILVCYERGLRCRSFIIGPWDLSLFYSQLIVIWVLKTSMDLIIVDLREYVRKFDFDPGNTWASQREVHVAMSIMKMMRADIQQQIYYIGLLHCASQLVRLTRFLFPCCRLCIPIRSIFNTK